jgi:excisionase family DNA binding protein
MNNLSRSVSAKELARLLNVNEFTIKKLAKEKQIPCRLIKRRYRFNLKTVLQFFRKLEGGAA